MDNAWTIIHAFIVHAWTAKKMDIVHTWIIVYNLWTRGTGEWRKGQH